MRRWLMNGLLLHGKSVRRDAARESLRVRSLDELGPEPEITHEPDAEKAFERAWAERLVSEACALVASRLTEAGRGRRFELFRRHVILGERGVDAARDLGFRPEECSALIRATVQQIRSALRELLTQDEINTSSIESEVRRIRDALKD